MSKHTITIDIDNGALIDQCASQILAQYHGDYDEDGELIDNGKHQPNKQIDRVIRETVIAKVRKSLDEAIGSVTGEYIRAAVADVMAEGWSKTDNYGCQVGPKLTLKDRISETLTKLQGDSYSSNRKNLIDAVIENAVSNAFKTDFAKTIEDAKVKFKAALDGTIAAKLQEALKSSLGLR